MLKRRAARQAGRGHVLRPRPRAGGAARARAADRGARCARCCPAPVTLLLPNPAGRFPLACATDAATLGLRVPAVAAGARRAGRRPLAGPAVQRQRRRRPGRPPAGGRARVHARARRPRPRRRRAARHALDGRRPARLRGRRVGGRSAREGAMSVTEVARAARVRAVTTSAFVTGGSGFIGGALVRRLVADGWTVRALARSDASARRRPRARRRAGARRARRHRLDGRGRRRLRGRLPLRRAPGRLGRARGLRARQRGRARATRWPPRARPACGASSTSAPRPRCSRASR